MNEIQVQQEHDRVVDCLEKRLVESGKYDQVYKHLHYFKEKKHGEADIVALFGSTLVYFEVKLHECEASFYGAKKQIERFKQCYNLTKCVGVYATPTCIRRVYL